MRSPSRIKESTYLTNVITPRILAKLLVTAESGLLTLPTAKLGELINRVVSF